ncbi:MAG: pseudoazurin [Pseudomonadota bacterium]
MSQEQDQIFFRNFSLIVGGIAVTMLLFFILAKIVVDDDEAQVKMRADKVGEITKPYGNVVTDSDQQMMDSAAESAEVATTDTVTNESVAGTGIVHVVEMKNEGADGTMVFEPAVINVAVGDTVKFVPTDQFHNSESIAGLIPDGATPWISEMSKEVSVTVDKEGVYVYQCTPHAAMAMVGVIVAGNPVNIDSVKTDASKLAGTFMMNGDRLDSYLVKAADTSAVVESAPAPATEEIAAVEPAAEMASGAGTVHTVEMKNEGADGTMLFEPAVLNVAVGDTVEFVPTDQFHNSESIAGLIPDGATPWKGEMNQKVTATIDKEGVYVYQCLPHAAMAMVGVIVAGEPANLDAIKTGASTMSGTFMMNNDRLDKYLSQVE